jgi:hypothetical protein
MDKMQKLPLYFNCCFFNDIDGGSIQRYKIDESRIYEHPFQLFRLVSVIEMKWENLSVYATLDDAIRIFLRELFTKELSDEVYHGQAVVNPAMILEKIHQGERSVSIYGSTNNEAFRFEFDVEFDALVERTIL